MDIRSARQAAGLSQSQLARAADVPQPNLSAYENGRRVPSPEVLDRLVRALAVRPSRGDDEPGSDIDLLVDFTDEASLLDETGLRLALADLLGVEVDVVAADGLSGRMLERVLEEAVAV